MNIKPRKVMSPKNLEIFSLVAKNIENAVHGFFNFVSNSPIALALVSIKNQSLQYSYFNEIIFIISFHIRWTRDVKL
jgi:hypothetical protein